MTDSKERIDWRGMFKRVVNRMREAGESQEMGARWMAEEASAAVFDLAQENERLRKALKPLAVLELPRRSIGNAGAYSIRHADILAAKDAIASPLPADNRRAE